MLSKKAFPIIYIMLSRVFILVAGEWILEKES